VQENVLFLYIFSVINNSKDNEQALIINNLNMEMMQNVARILHYQLLCPR
jgi:hypothetical protein